MTIYTDGLRVAQPDRPITEYWAYDKLRVITDAKDFIVPALWFGAAVFFWLGMRLLFAPSARHLRRRLGSWLLGDKD